MRTVLFWLALSLPGLAAQLQTLPNAPAPARTRLTATGTVVNSVTGEPVPRALVRINGMGVQQSEFTGADGRFSIDIDDVAQGRLIATAQKPGYFDERVLGGNFSPVGFIDVGPATGDLLLKLVPAASVAGKVVDRDGDPIESVQIQVLRKTIVDGHKVWQNRGGAITDENGTYRIDNLMPGTYLIRTSPHSVFAGYGQVVVAKGQPEVYGPEFYPAGSDLSTAQPLALEAGATAQGDFTLSAVPAYIIRGTVAGASSRVGIFCEDADGQQVSTNQRFDSKTGRFAVYDVPAGSWRLEFTGNAEGKLEYAERTVNVSASDISGINVELQAPPSIPVHIVSATAGLNVNVQLTQYGKQPMGANTFQAQRDPMTGSLLFRDVMPGTYRVAAYVMGPGCVDSITSGGTDLTRENLTVLAGSQPPPLEVNLLDQCAHLSGSVVSATGPASGTVLLVAEDSSLAPLPMAVWGGGKFQLANLRPGAYRVYAFANIADVEYANPEALRGLPSQEVALTAGQSAQIQLELIPQDGK